MGEAMKKIVVGAVLAAGLGLAGIAGAGVASAAPGMDFACAPCVGDVNGDGVNNPVWDEITSFGPWEKVFDPAGDGNGAWEQGVTAVNGGVWEKAFPAEAASPPAAPEGGGDEGGGAEGGGAE